MEPIIITIVASIAECIFTLGILIIAFYIVLHKDS